MCIKYTCRVCKAPNTIYCPSADWNQVNPKCDEPTFDPQPHLKHKKCHTCELVEGAIHELRTLVFQMPWLETEGLGGAADRPAWELSESPGTIRENKVIDWSRAQDMELMQRIEAMGLDSLDGKDTLNDGHGVKVTTTSDDTTTCTAEEEESGSEQRHSTWGSYGSAMTCTTAEEGLNEQYVKSTE